MDETVPPGQKIASPPPMPAAPLRNPAQSSAVRNTVSTKFPANYANGTIFPMRPDHDVTTVRPAAHQPSVPRQLFNVTAKLQDFAFLDDTETSNMGNTLYESAFGGGNDTFFSRAIKQSDHAGNTVLVFNRWDPCFVEYQSKVAVEEVKKYSNCEWRLDQKAPVIAPGASVKIGLQEYSIGRARPAHEKNTDFKVQSYDCVLSKEGIECVLKVDKPVCRFEIYVCHELKKRLETCGRFESVRNGIQTFRHIYMFNNAAISVTDKSYGTLVDLIKAYKKCGIVGGLSEYLVAYITLDILRILEAAHGQNIIHGDVEPKHFEILSAPPVKLPYTDPMVRTVRLVNWSYAIDRTLADPKVKFTCDQTYPVKCIEILEGRSWTFQVDYYGMLATVHYLIFGSPMKPRKLHVLKWVIDNEFKNHWRKEFWGDFFDVFLNIRDRCGMPIISEWRARFESFLEKYRTSKSSNWEGISSSMNDVLKSMAE